MALFMIPFVFADQKKPAAGSQIGDKVYLETGNNTGKWVTLSAIQKYNNLNHLYYEAFIDDGKVYEKSFVYDKDGNNTYVCTYTDGVKNTDVYEEWNEFDSQKKKIHMKVRLNRSEIIET